MQTVTAQQAGLQVRAIFAGRRYKSDTEELAPITIRAEEGMYSWDMMHALYVELERQGYNRDHSVLIHESTYSPEKFDNIWKAIGGTT